MNINMDMDNCNCNSDQNRCPIHTCRNSTCFNMVNKINNKLNFYCMKHMRCGLEVDPNNPVCKGCLKTYQNYSDKEDIDTEATVNTEDTIDTQEIDINLTVNL